MIPSSCRMNKAGWAVVFILGAMNAIAAPDAQEPFVLIAGPVLQAVSATEATVVWASNRNAVSWVEYGDGAQLGQKSESAAHGLIDAMTQVHRITLTKLQPNTEYTYRVCSKEIIRFQPYQVDFGDVASSETRTFRTPGLSDAAVSLVVVNDIHNSVRLWKTLFQIAGAKPYDFAVLNGDVLADPMSHEAAVGLLLKPAGEFLAGRIPFVFVRGNHETRGPWARHLPDYLAMPNGRYYYAFTRGPVRFLALDGGEDKPDANQEYFGLVDFTGYLAQEIAWLEQEIKSQAFQSAAFRVVFMHIPRPLESPIGPDDPRGQFGPLLQEGRTDLLVSGHTHTQAIVEAEPGRRDYPVFIGGGNEAGSATVIRLEATDAQIEVTVLRDNGETLANRIIAKKAS